MKLKIKKRWGYTLKNTRYWKIHSLALKKREKKNKRDGKLFARWIYFLVHSYKNSQQFSSFGKLNIKRNTNSKIENSKISSLNNFNSGISTIPFYQFCLIRKQNKWKTHGGREEGEEGGGGGRKKIHIHVSRAMNK